MLRTGLDVALMQHVWFAVGTKPAAARDVHLHQLRDLPDARMTRYISGARASRATGFERSCMKAS